MSSRPRALISLRGGGGRCFFSGYRVHSSANNGAFKSCLFVTVCAAMSKICRRRSLALCRVLTFYIYVCVRKYIIDQSFKVGNSTKSGILAWHLRLRMLIIGTTLKTVTPKSKSVFILLSKRIIGVEHRRGNLAGKSHS